MARRLAAALVLVALGAGTPGAEPATWRLDETFGERGRGRNELKEPVDVALARNGGVAVLDRDREAVALFEPSGRWERTLGGSRGQGELSLKKPTALALDRDDRLWIVDHGNHRVVVADGQGKVLETLGSLGTADGRFRYPSDLAFDRSGRVYVADTGNERIQVFGADGSFLAAWERRTGGRREHLEAPVAVAYSDHGRGSLWVLNRGWTRLVRFALDGSWEESLDLPPGEDGAPVEYGTLEVEPGFYRMVLSETRGGAVVVVDRRGAVVGRLGGDALAGARPGGVAVDKKLNLYLADGPGARVLRFEAVQ